MKPGEPSRTAMGVALRRATHQLIDRPLVFDDPLAVTMLGEEMAQWLRADPRRGEARVAPRAMRAFLVARSRIAEDALRRAYDQGCRQYVVLGAGLDTFAYRQALADLRVFEVDQPWTQQWKRARLADVGISEPGSLTFVPVDFETEILATQLQRAGVDASRPVFFSWLGVSMYLTEAVVWHTLATVAAMTRSGGGITFDYGATVTGNNISHRLMAAALARRVAAAGEPFRSSFAPQVIADHLHRLGFIGIDDLDDDAMNARYFANRDDGLAVRGSGRIVTAWAG